MPRKAAQTPIITHTEVLALAIRTIDADIQKWRERCEGLSEEHFNNCTEGLRQKRDALCILYRIETGIDYD